MLSPPEISGPERPLSAVVGSGIRNCSFHGKDLVRFATGGPGSMLRDGPRRPAGRRDDHAPDQLVSWRIVVNEESRSNRSPKCSVAVPSGRPTIRSGRRREGRAPYGVSSLFQRAPAIRPHSSHCATEHQHGGMAMHEHLRLCGPRPTDPQSHPHQTCRPGLNPASPLLGRYRHGTEIPESRTTDMPGRSE